jgi:hypothetical protein
MTTSGPHHTQRRINIRSPVGVVRRSGLPSRRKPVPSRAWRRRNAGRKRFHINGLCIRASVVMQHALAKMTAFFIRNERLAVTDLSDPDMAENTL